MFTQDLLQSDCSVIWIWLKSRFCSAVWSHLLHRGETVQNPYVRSRYQTRMKERKKAYWKQSQYTYFSLGFFSFSHFFCVCVCVSWLMTRVWGTTHITGGQAGCVSSTWDSSAEALQGKEGQIVAPFHLWPLSLWDSARGDDWIRLWTSAELWAYSSELLTDRISFVTVEGYDGLEPTAV